MDQQSPVYDFTKVIKEQEAAGFIIVGFEMNSTTMKRLKDRLKRLGILIADPLDSPIDMIQGLPIKINESLNDYEVALQKIHQVNRFLIPRMDSQYLAWVFYQRGIES